MSDRFIVLGLAGPRAPWFTAVGQWTHAGSLPADFTKCVSAEELRTRLASGRTHSAVLLDGALPAIDRDVIAAARDNGSAVLVVDARERANHWTELGADEALPLGFGPADLLGALRAHAATVPSTAWTPPLARPEMMLSDPGALLVLCGPGGTGVSTLAIALAQQLAACSAVRSRVVLADLCLHAEQGMLHDAGDVGPGIQELVDLCRTVTPDGEQVRATTHFVDERGYALLLGLRRPSAWPTLRPRAVTVAIRSLRHAFNEVVCDADAEFEGQAESGSVDLEERNVLARVAAKSADVVIPVGLPGLKGVYSLARVIGELVDAGVPPSRIAPVINRMARGPRGRARTTLALNGLLSPDVRTELASPVFIPERDVELALHDRRQLPSSLGASLVGLARAVAARAVIQAGDADTADGRRIEPGSLAAVHGDGAGQ